MEIDPTFPQPIPDFPDPDNPNIPDPIPWPNSDADQPIDPM